MSKRTVNIQNILTFFCLIAFRYIKRTPKVGQEESEMLKYTRPSDPEIYELLAEELHRQENNIEMIASESTAPLEVMELSGSVFTNKTLEGYPGKRFQAGSEVADKIERLGWERAKELFGAEHVNLQSYSGSTANYSVFAAVLEPGDKILSMRPDQGGHLTHGSPANWMSKFYHHDFYGVNPETEQIDYDDLEKTAKEVQPKLIIAGASAYPRLIDYERIAKIAEEVGAYFMVDMAHIAGLVAAKLIPSPIPHADFVTSSTTKTFCSARSGMVFCKEKHAKMLDRGTFPGALGSIHLQTMAAKIWSFKYAQSDEFKATMQRVLDNAQTLAAELTKRGFRIVSGGTDNHLLLVAVVDMKRLVHAREYRHFAAVKPSALVIFVRQIFPVDVSPFCDLSHDNTSKTSRQRLTALCRLLYPQK